MYSVMLKLSVAGHSSLTKDFMGHFFSFAFFDVPCFYLHYVLTSVLNWIYSLRSRS